MKKPLLVIQSSEHLSSAAHQKIFEMVAPVAELLDAELIVSDVSSSVMVHQDMEPLVVAIRELTEELKLQREERRLQFAIKS